MKQAIVFLLFLPYCLPAQDVDFRLNHMALSVEDVDLSATFYAEVLGLEEITNRSEIEGIRWFSLGEGKELHLISIIKEPIATNKAIHLGLTISNFEAFVLRLERLNIAYTDWPGNSQSVFIRADGIKQIYFQDPDGYWIEVNNIIE